MLIKMMIKNVLLTTMSYCLTERAKATAKFNELRKVLMDISVNMTTRRKLLEACVCGLLEKRKFEN